MQHEDHIALIQEAVGTTQGIWADFGSGTGAFTLALADITRQQATIYSIDKDKRGLEKQKEAMDQLFPDTKIHYQEANFTDLLELPPLDGILMANALHFVREPVPLLIQFRSYLKPGGKLVMVEYNSDEGNIWVPYPFSYDTFQHYATDAGFTEVRCVQKAPSHFLDEMYAALAINPY